MKLVFDGLERSVNLSAGSVATFEIHNRVLFARISESLVSGLGADALEPYAFWSEEGEELKPDNQCLFVNSPLELPWSDRLLFGAIASRVEKLLRENPQSRQEFEEMLKQTQALLSGLVLELDSDYSFALDYSVKSFLKTSGFGIELNPEEAIIDKLIRFIHLAKDASLKKVLVFVNLKLFLGKEELQALFEQIFFSNLHVLLLETVHDQAVYKQEKKYTVDLDFLEY